MKITYTTEKQSNTLNWPLNIQYVKKISIKILKHLNIEQKCFLYAIKSCWLVSIVVTVERQDAIVHTVSVSVIQKLTHWGKCIVICQHIKAVKILNNFTMVHIGKPWTTIQKLKSFPFLTKFSVAVLIIL